MATFKTCPNRTVGTQQPGAEIACRGLYLDQIPNLVTNANK
jgi:hypothetical protein